MCSQTSAAEFYSKLHSLRFLLPRNGPAPSYQDCKGIGEAHIYSFLLFRVPNFGSRMKSPSKSGMETEKKKKVEAVEGSEREGGERFYFTSPKLNHFHSRRVPREMKGPPCDNVSTAINRTLKALRFMNEVDSSTNSWGSEGMEAPRQRRDESLKALGEDANQGRGNSFAMLINKRLIKTALWALINRLIKLEPSLEQIESSPPLLLPPVRAGLSSLIRCEGRAGAVCIHSDSLSGVCNILQLLGSPRSNRLPLSQDLLNWTRV